MINIKKLQKGVTACTLAAMVAVSASPMLPGNSVYADTTPEASTTFTFTDSGITASGDTSGYKISGTDLTIQSAGTYAVTGSCSEGSVKIKKGISDVSLVLDSLTLTSSSTAPLAVNKSNSNVAVYLKGNSVLTDKEDASTEDTYDDFEGAAVKVKSSSSVTFSGSGTLTADGSSCKNGIKGASESSITFNSGTYIVKAANNGIAADGSLEFNDGKYTLTTDNDGIKSVPDEDDTSSTGQVVINGGSYTINASGDGIQADQTLDINGGTFKITTLSGYNDKSFDKDTMSCKGLKASGDRGKDNYLDISGGTFNLNTADDALHSDTYANVTGGTFTIKTGDDGAHADGTMKLGTSTSGPDITISSSYEGLEAGNLYVYGGSYNVTASDDGLNAAGGSSNGTSGSGTQDGFKTGGAPSGSSSNYNIYISGGDITVNCSGDGLDSNGGLYVTGGTQKIFAQSSGDNTAIDADGTVSLKGATMFTAGSYPTMDPVSSSWFSSQKYLTASGSYSKNLTVTISDGGSTVDSVTLPKAASFLMYTSPSLSSSASWNVSSSSNQGGQNDQNNQNNNSGSTPGQNDQNNNSGSTPGQNDQNNNSNFTPGQDGQTPPDQNSSFGQDQDSSQNGSNESEQANQDSQDAQTDKTEEDTTANTGSENGSTSENTSVSVGTVAQVGNQSYKVTEAADGSLGSVTFTEAKNAATVIVPNTVTLADGSKYKVTSISADAFTGSRIRTVKVGKNVETIEENAFSGSNATKIVLRTKALTKASVKGCLNTSSVSKIVVKLGSGKLNKKYVKKYKKIFTKANAGSKVTVK